MESGKRMRASISVHGKFTRMKEAGIPEQAIYQAMINDGQPIPTQGFFSQAFLDSLPEYAFDQEPATARRPPVATPFVTGANMNKYERMQAAGVSKDAIWAMMQRDAAAGMPAAREDFSSARYVNH